MLYNNLVLQCMNVLAQLHNLMILMITSGSILLVMFSIIEWQSILP